MPVIKNALPRLIVLSGPTGVGKTGLSLDLAQRFKAEIINCDSRQVYRYLDIGTAKPTPAEQTLAPHHLLDVADPDENFDAAAYLRLTRPLIDRLHQRGVPILVVGGTGLYLRSLLKGLFEGPGRDAEIRARLEAEAKTQGPGFLHARLAQVDPPTAARLHPHDLVRIIRGLEVFELTKKTISAFQAGHGLKEKPYEVLFLVLVRPKEELHQRIETRTREMFEGGLLEEVKGLLERGYSPELKTMKSIGYRQAVEHLAGDLTLEEAMSDTIKETRRLAKRQMTWFRSQPEARWTSPQESKTIIEEATRFLNQDST